MAKNTFLPQARAEVKTTGDIFAFISQAGAARLSQFFTHLLLGRALAGTPLAGMPEGLMAELAQGTVEAMAYSTSFEQGGVRDRYAVLCRPDVVSSLHSSLRAARPPDLAKSAALQLVPAAAQEILFVTVEDPGQAIEGVEQIVSAHLGVAQSFLFHRFFTSARQMFLGLAPGESAAATAGTEVVRFSLPPTETGQTERVWIVAARNRDKLAQWATRLLQQQGTRLGRSNYQGTVLTSTNSRAFAFLDHHLVLGAPAQVKRLLAEQGKPSAVGATATTAESLAQQLGGQLERLQPTEGASQRVLYSFGSVATETAQMMAIVARHLRANPQAVGVRPLQQLPWAVTVTSLTTRGLYREAQSPVGNFPLIVTFVDAIL